MVTTAIIPAAGLGTRLEPISLAIPKELAPVYDSVALLQVCEEAVAAGIKHLVIVNSPRKSTLVDAVENHFSQLEIEDRTRPSVVEVVQPSPKGLGHAVACAVPEIDQYPVTVLLPDVLLPASTNTLSRMIEIAGEGHSVLCIKKARQPQLSFSGVVDVSGLIQDGSIIDDIVEKPEPGTEPSDYMVVGRYVLTRAVFENLEESDAGATAEVELTDAISTEATGHPGSVLACQLDDTYRDIGTIDGLFLAGLHRFAEVKTGTRQSTLATELINQIETDLGLI